MKETDLSWLVLALGGAVIAAALFFYFNNPYARGKGGPRVLSLAHLQRIGLAIRDYCSDHGGELPPRFSDLVPRYIPTTNLSVFYAPAQQAKAPRSLPRDWHSNPKLVDAHSSYVYLGVIGTTNSVLAFEKPGLWEPDLNSWMDQRLAVLFDDYRVELTPLPTLKKLLPAAGAWLEERSTNSASRTEPFQR